MDRIHQLIKRSEQPPESVVQLLENTLIGTEGSLYRLLNTREKIHLLYKPLFLFIERNEKAIGNVTICERPIQLNQQKQDSLYIRYFAFDQLFQGGSAKGKANSAFHDYMRALFNTSNCDPINAKNDKSLYWAFIDPQNLRSFNMNERFGFETIGTFRTKAFSRVNPKLIKGVRKINQDEIPEIKKEIDSFYADFSFYSDVHLFEANNFYVYEYNGEVVAGIQGNPVAFEIKSLPGLKGKMLVKTLPYIPRLRKLINPKEHKFLATEGLFWKEGHADKVQRLLEGVLYRSMHHSLLIWQDENNPMLDNLQVKWGFIQKSKDDNPINIVAKFNGFSEDEKQQIRSSKKYLSGFDMT